MSRALDWCCRYGTLALTAVLATCLLHAAGLEFGPALVQMIAQESAILGIVTIGAMVVFHGGAFDLSLGAVFALALVALAMLLDAGSAAAAVASVLVGGLLVGALTGFLGFALRAPVLVGALMAVAWREAALAIAGAYPVAPNSAAAQSLQALSWQTAGGVSLSFLIFIGAALVLHKVLGRTAVGRKVIAVGLSTRRARMAGVRWPMYRAICYGVGGMAAALGALMYFSLLTTGNPQVGLAMPFEVLAAIIIGNGGLHRGRPAPLRVALAVICLTALQTGAPGVMHSPWSVMLVTVLAVMAALLGQRRTGLAGSSLGP